MSYDDWKTTESPEECPVCGSTTRCEHAGEDGPPSDWEGITATERAEIETAARTLGWPVEAVRFGFYKGMATGVARATEQLEAVLCGARRMGL